MNCPECDEPVDLSRSKWLAPFRPAKCLSCGHVLHFYSFLFGVVGLVEFLVLATACVLLYGALR